MTSAEASQAIQKEVRVKGHPYAEDFDPSTSYDPWWLWREARLADEWPTTMI